MNGRIIIPVVCLCTLFKNSNAQILNQDSVKINAGNSLQEVVVNAFQSNIKWKEAPAAVALISMKDLQLQSIANFLPAFNAIAGVKLEERSPSSYRISIRGSTLRSPFGVRNVKVYWNNIPLSDAGGNTYFNLLNVSSVNAVEMVKGPAASMYGAGTGGVILLRSAVTANNNEELNATIFAGSYGLLNENISWIARTSKFSSLLQQSHQQSDGYRQQTATNKNTLQWNAFYQTQRSQFNFLAFYTNQFYQTPGGLTKAQMLLNPQQARLATSNLPGAVQQQTAIYNITTFGGVEHMYTISKNFCAETSFMLNHSSVTNPFITNYEERDETNSGLKTQLVYRKQLNSFSFQWNTGVEWLYNHSVINDFGNRGGQKDTVQFKDNLFANQSFAFTQIQLHNNRLFVNAGISWNEQNYRYKRLTDINAGGYASSTHDMVTPRIAVLLKLNTIVSWYGIISKGFSPPSLAEIHPSDGLFHAELQPEFGWNIETGLKGNLWNDKLFFDLTAYSFKLQNAIVRRNNPIGSEYFVNAGNASEKGIELFIKYRLINTSKGLIRRLALQSAYAYQPYTFGNYMQGAINYSGNAVTGVAKHIWVSSIASEWANDIYCNISFNINSQIPLNDANDEYANTYHLLQIKLGKYFLLYKASLHLYAGADNILNELYSLGNDINAAGRRYYNPAADRSFYAGVSIRL